MPGEPAPALVASLRTLFQRDPRPPAWSDAGNLPWDDPEFSERMLKVHLDDGQQGASRPAPQRTAIIDWLIEHLGLRDDTYLLDLACGPGLYALELARRDVPVTGIDFAPAAVTHAQRQAAVHRLEDRASFVLADVRLANLGVAAFDAATMLYGQLTVFRPEETQALLERTRRALTPGGVVAFEVLDPEYIDRSARTWWRTAEASIWGDTPHIDFGESYFDAAAESMVQRHHIIHLDTGKLETISICDQVYEPARLETMLRDAGFDTVETYRAWDGLDLPDARRWIVYIARVPS